MTSYRVVDRSGGRSLLDRISGKQKQKSVKEVAEEVRAAALQVGRRGITYHMYYQFRAGLLRPGSTSARPPWRGDSGTAAAVRPRLRRGEGGREGYSVAATLQLCQTFTVAYFLKLSFLNLKFKEKDKQTIRIAFESDYKLAKTWIVRKIHLFTINCHNNGMFEMSEVSDVTMLAMSGAAAAPAGQWEDGEERGLPPRPRRHPHPQHGQQGRLAPRGEAHQPRPPGVYLLYRHQMIIVSDAVSRYSSSTWTTFPPPTSPLTSKLQPLSWHEVISHIYGERN